jgi:hypothetical protein
MFFTPGPFILLLYDNALCTVTFCPVSARNASNMRQTQGVPARNAVITGLYKV